MKKSDQAKLAELESRLYDIAQGSMGGSSFDWIGDDGGLAQTMGVEEWVRWIMAIKKIFGIAGEDAGLRSAPAESMAFELWNLHYFAESIEEAAAHLFKFGARP